jgi:NTE family protein
MALHAFGSSLASSVLLAFVATAAFAQPGDRASGDAIGDRAPAGRERPSVGLVLSGGGARGGAHVGVLRALEELRVPIDHIAGTSIGAAIGGIYATGMTVAEIEEFLASINWDAAFRNLTPRQLRSFRRKRDDDLYLVGQRPGLNDGEFQLPIGVVQGQVIDMIMSRVVLDVAGIRDFDDLAIPFRAVAGDIATGEAVILESGDLGRAIRASMAVPAALAPMEIDGRLLVDGGIVMNLPIEVAKSMGADVVVAIDITDVLASREELRSVVDVTEQLTSLLTRYGMAQQIDLLTEVDVLLTPEFTEEFSSISFSRINETVQTGYDAVMENRELFAPLALDEAGYAAYKAQLRNPRATATPMIDFVRISNDSSIADSVIEARMTDIKIGEPLNVDALERSLNRIYGLELYQNVRYELLEEEGQTGLEVSLTERSWGPNYLQLGVEYSSASDQDAVFGLAASYLRTAINDLGGEWRATFFLGDEPGFQIDLYQPLGAQALYFVEPSLDFQSTLLNVFDAGELGAELQLRQGILEVAAGRELPTWGEIRFGLRGGSGDTRLRVGDPTLVPDDDFRRGEHFTRFSADTFDSITFPREGMLATAEWRASRTGFLSADVDFDQLLISAAHAKTWGRHTLLSTLRYDATISGEVPVSGLFSFGGFLDLSGLHRNELSGKYVTRIGTSYYRRIGDLALFPAFAGISIELGNAWQSRDDISVEDSVFGGSIWAGVDTPVGPIYLSYGLAEGGDNAFYVVMGRIF